MADAVALAGPRGNSRSNVHFSWNFHLAAALLAPAALLGLLRVWSLTLAPRQGAYFTAEALLIAYAYFAAVRGVYLHVHSHDRAGHYDRVRAKDAQRTFHRELRRYWPKLALVVLPLLLAAFTLDALTADTGVQRRLNVNLSILFVGLMVWARYGAAVVIASALWTPPWPPKFAHAREVANGMPVAASFAVVNVALFAATVAMLAAYKWGGALLPSTEAEQVCLAGVFTALAWLALWLHCRWALYVLPHVERRPAADAPALVLQRAA